MVAELRSLVARMAGQRILVIGDLILDEYVTGVAERMSREAPVPVLEFLERRYIPGGAANPSSNIVRLAGQPVQIGLVGDDDVAERLRTALAERGIDASQLVVVPGRPTTLKTRILAQMGLRFPQQVARIDTLTREPAPPQAIADILARVRANLPGAGAVLVSDYGGGLLVPEIIQALCEQAHAQAILCGVDAQGNLEHYAGYDIIKCNADDVRRYTGRTLASQPDFVDAARDLQSRLNARRAFVITLGAGGAVVAPAGSEPYHVPAPQVSDVFDTVGAGDTHIAVLMLALAAGADLYSAVQLANIASGIVVRHVGNYAPHATELMEAIS